MSPHEKVATPSPGRPQIAVRPMRDGEHEQVRAIVDRAFDAFDRLLFSTRGRETLVAVDGDGRIVGGLVLRATASGRLGRLGMVDFVFADPEVRIPGIGTRLRDAADARFEELGCRETAARIDVTNSASQALHRSGGYRPATVSQQLRRWRWPLPLRWWQIGTGFDPGAQLWLRPAAEDRGRRPLWRALTVTAALNLLLLAIVAVRAPRAEVDLWPVAGALGATVAILLGAREVAIRTVARRQGLRLGHEPWTMGIVLGVVVAAGLGVWFPLTGSSIPQRPGWRHDREITALGQAHLAGALAVAALAWTVALVEPSITWLAWDEVRRAVVTLALFDLVLGFSPLVGTAARHVRAWSATAWGVLVVLGAGPLLVNW